MTLVLALVIGILMRTLSGITEEKSEKLKYTYTRRRYFMARTECECYCLLM